MKIKTLQPVIKYHYNLIEDIKAHIYMWRNMKWLKENKIIIIYPSPLKTLKVALNWWILKHPKVKFQCKKDIHCYWVSAGTWGSYWPPDKIWICPIKNPHLERTVKHEITHIIYDQDVQSMTHKQKEVYIESKENSW